MPTKLEMLDMIQELVEQDCAEIVHGKATGDYNSHYITVYAEAMLMLGRAGRMSIQYDGGRYVWGRFVTQEVKDHREMYPECSWCKAESGTFV